MKQRDVEYDPRNFISRELSWIDFNSRVLDEASFDGNKLLDKLKFISIVSGNLDEFFMVRIAGLRQLVDAGENRPDPAGNRPERQLQLAKVKISRLLRRQYNLLMRHILPELEEHGVFIRHPEELPEKKLEQLHRYFNSQILPVLTPLAVDPAHPFPLLNSGAIEIALELKRKKLKERKEMLRAFVEVPEVLPRFIALDNISEFEPEPDDSIPLSAHGDSPVELILLEELIAYFITDLFPGCEIADKLFFRITRDMDFSVEDDVMDNLMTTISGKLLQRRQRGAIRLEIAGDSSRSKLARYLMKELGLAPELCYSLPGPLHLKQFMEMVQLANRPELMEENLKPLTPAVFRQYPTVFDAVRARENILLALPYCSFAPVVDMLEQAANDPDVLAIKQTLYRVSGNSPIVRALQKAAENGKQVTVVLELKARFDESNNIAWAKLLDSSGAHVIYGIAGLKVHSKALLIVRKESGRIRRYVHLGTGNYNDKTAKLYTDMGLLSCDPALCYDVANLFNLLSGCSAPPERWERLAVSPFDMRKRFTGLVEREIRHCRSGHSGRIIAKMNSLADPGMIELLHRAADAGVEIDLIVRGICCFRPHPKQDNVRIYSIVDRFLEHTRIFCFENLGESEYYLSSADWMSRNLDRRIETLFPVQDDESKLIIRKFLEFQLADEDKRRKLLSTGAYTRPRGENYSELRSQIRSYRFLQKLYNDQLNGPAETLKVFTS
ncbi:MAG: polyphosphate kinase 1 [Lentisphaerae bacterium]|nr:polyphosphate kinase 1 [Lentisphaerota bacterium]